MKTKYISIITIIIIVLMLIKCDSTVIKHKIITSLGGYTHKEYIKTVDTFRYTVKKYADTTKSRLISVTKLNNKRIDSNYVVNKNNTFRLSGNQKNINILPLHPPTIISKAYTTFNIISDTLIHGTIKTVIDSENCNIVEQSFDYKAKFPILVTEYITIKEKEIEVISKDNTNKIGLGANAISNGSFGIFGVYQTKNNWQIQAGALFVNNKNLLPNTSNSKYIQVGIIKLF